MTNRNRIVLVIAALLFVTVVVVETLVPANVVGAYAFVLPILLVASTRNRKLLYLTLVFCIIATYIGLMRPTKPGRFVSAVINRTLVVCVLGGVAYLGLTWEERKAREEAARAALALQTENLLKAHAQLAEVKDALNRAERLAAVGQLVASVAHEVGTPLHSIAWHVRALREEAALTPDMAKRLDTVESQINRVVLIIQDLLSTTRQRKPNPAWTPALQLLHSVAALMEPTYVTKGVKLSVTCRPESLVLWADPEQMQQVLVNLLSNALAATPSGGEVLLSAEQQAVDPIEAEEWQRIREEVPGNVAVLSVDDNGCGMPPEHVRQTVEPFFTTKEIGKGSGLGLFLSREIVKAHGGRLSIHSEVGKGTKVLIALPMEDRADRAA
ncbi:putative Histidine kinase [Nitrospira tepida]|uniref:histidine kinase n=1 Tax=Nitrospira tepida TaxID=2973512 RepID=A0AA86T3U2_9BACT|nr:ATP-binding protein [Nitrospira tepida]CAI4031181.1 putative Histidine kinase [Nitrospira tepida]